MTQTEEIWMRKNWPHLSNATCGIYLGKHPRTVVRMARELGLVKSQDFIEQARRINLKKASEINAIRMKGIYNPNLQKWNNRNKKNLI